MTPHNLDGIIVDIFSMKSSTFFPDKDGRHDEEPGCYQRPVITPFLTAIEHVHVS